MTKIFQKCAIFIPVFFLTACTVTGPERNIATLSHIPHPSWYDVYFYEPNIVIPSPETIFEITPKMQQFINTHVRRTDNSHTQMRALSDAIFAYTDMNMLYAANANSTAKDTFTNRTANCLSLTIMTYTLAKEAGFNSEFQEVHIPEYWTRRGGQSLINSHVNLRVKPSTMQRQREMFSQSMVVDFDPLANRSAIAQTPISKARITAMFYNNNAADALLVKQHPQAYAFLKAALTADPMFADAWTNLGLLYKREGFVDDAQLAYQRAIEIADTNSAWENLAHLYQRIELTDQANEIFERLAQRRAKNPYYHYMLGQTAAANQEWHTSITHYRKALRIDDTAHQFYAGIGFAFREIGDIDNSERYFKLAKRHATYRDEVALYQRKLAYLRVINDTL